MTADGSQSIFSRVDPDALRRPDEPAAPKPAKPAAPAAKRPRRRNRWRWRRAVHVAAPVVWVVGLVNGLVFNLEAVLARVLPGFAAVLQYRLLFVTVALVVAVTFWRSRSFYLSVLYIAFYPLVVLGWIVPRFLWRHRSWDVGIGALHATFGLVGGFRRGVYLWTVIVLDVVLILTRAGWTSAIATILASGLLLVVLWLMLVQALKPDRFLDLQVKSFKWWVADPDRFEIPSELRKPHGGKLTAEESNLVADRAASATTTVYLGRFWAGRLREYVRGKAFVLFGALAVARYALLLVLCFTLANASLYGANPEQYSAERGPSWIAWVQYSFASMVSGDVHGIAAQGDLARLLATVASICGWVLVPIVLTALWQGYRFSTTSGSGEGPIGAIEQQCDKLEKLVHDVYYMPIGDVARQLIQWNNFLIGLLVGITSASGVSFGLPDDLAASQRRTSPAGNWQGLRDKAKAQRGRRGRARARREGR